MISQAIAAEQEKQDLAKQYQKMHEKQIIELRKELQDDRKNIEQMIERQNKLITSIRIKQMIAPKKKEKDSNKSPPKKSVRLPNMGVTSMKKMKASIRNPSVTALRKMQSLRSKTKSCLDKDSFNISDNHSNDEIMDLSNGVFEHAELQINDLEFKINQAMQSAVAFESMSNNMSS